MVAGQIFQLEILSTEDQLRAGLGGRESLPQDTGVLFAFSQPQSLTFWMKDVLFPLDVLFFDADGVITDVHSMVPEPRISDALLSRYASSATVVYALEINGGRAGELGISAGDMVQLQ